MLGFIKLPNKRRVTPKIANLAPMARVLHASSLKTAALSHTRVPYTNISGRACTNIEVLYTHWTYNASIEYSPTSNATVRSAVEYPSGTITPLTTDGSNRDVNIVGGGLSAALKASGLNIPNGAVFWIRTRCLISGGDGALCTNYTNSASHEGGTIQSWTGADDSSDYTLTGLQPTNAGSAFGPSAVCSREVGNKSKSFAIIGDSISRGSSSGGVSYAEVGVLGAGYTYLNVAVSGSKITDAGNNLMPRRRALLKAANCLETIIGYPVNDLIAAKTNAQIQTACIANWTALKGDGFGKIIQATCSPKTVTNISTPDTVPTGAFTGGTVSFRSIHNAWLRSQAGQANRPDFVYELSDVWEASRDSGTWKDTTVTTDFLHPTAAAATTAGNNLTTFLTSIGY